MWQMKKERPRELARVDGGDRFGRCLSAALSLAVLARDTQQPLVLRNALTKTCAESGGRPNCRVVETGR